MANLIKGLSKSPNTLQWQILRFVDFVSVYLLELSKLCMVSEVFWTQIGFQIGCQHFQGKLKIDYTSPFHRPLIIHIVMNLGGNIDIITCLSHNLTSMGTNAKQINKNFPVAKWIVTEYYIARTNDNTVSWLKYVSPMIVLI